MASPSISKTQRWLDLIAYLAGRRVPVTVEELMEAVPAYAAKYTARDADDTDRATVRRMFERDKDELRALGIPVDTVRFNVNYGLEVVDGYRLAAKDFYLPYLRLLTGRDPATPASTPRQSGAATFEVSEDDVQAAARALRSVGGLPSFPFAREARSALRKLTFDLDASFGDAADVRFLDPPEEGDVRGTLPLLTDALLRRKTVAFRYYGIHRDRQTTRRVRPYGLLFQHSHWYLVAWDEDRGAMRVFRAGRMTDVKVHWAKANTPDYDIPDDFDLADWSRREAWELGGEDEPPLEVDVLFPFPRSVWAQRNGHGELVEERPGGAALRRFRVHQAGPFLRWMLSLEGEARIERPDSVRDALRDVARRVAEAHGGAGPGGAEAAGHGDAPDPEADGEAPHG